jgi:hypothetical protein
MRGERRVRASATIVAAAAILSACSRPPAAAPPPAERPGFVNRVWRVERSTAVSPGTLYVFLSDGTLVVASPNGKPSLGTWKREVGELTMVEEGITYAVDILRLDAAGFAIRSHNPGEPVDIEMVPAPSPPVEAR